MKTLHLAGTIIGLVGCSFLLTVGCGSSTTKARGGTGGHGNTTGNGGSGQSGATNGGGNGNTNNGGGAPVDCASVAIVDSTDTLVADFECLPGPQGQKFDWAPWPNWDSWQHGAYGYYDPANAFDASYQTWDCLPTARWGLSTPGANGSSTAGYVEALVPKTSYGAGFGFWMGGSATTPDVDTAVSCIDVSAFTGISFYVKGVNTGSEPAGGYTVQFITFDTQNAYPATPRTCTTDADGSNVCTGTKAGGCTAAACDPYTWAGTLPADWTKVTIMWTDLIAPTTGVTAPFNPAKLTSINIPIDASKHGGTVQFYIDDVEWVGGGPTTLPRTCPAPAAGGATGAGGAPDYTAWMTAGAGGLAALPTCTGTPEGGAGP